MSQENWESRYQSGDTPWEKGTPSPGLVDFLEAHPELPRGTVCVPGCGLGHDARRWAQHGFRAYGYDIAPSAIRLATELTRAASTNVGFRQADFLGDEPPFLFDWIFEHTLFCAIDPGERVRYVSAVRRWLKPGGHYLAVNYMIVDADACPPFPSDREELCRLFSPHLELIHDWVPRSYPNRADRERMFWWRKRPEAGDQKSEARNRKDSKPAL